MRMLRWILILYATCDFLIGYAGLIPITNLAAAQFTTVTGTVIDPNGLPYAFGTISATLITSASPTLNGFAYTPPTQPTGLSMTGSFTMQLADNTVLLPAATKWSFFVCSAIGTVNPAIGKGSVCFTAGPLTISGASQDITATLNAAALALSISASSSNSAAPLWIRAGTVLYPRVDLAVDQQALQETSVMYDTSGNCSILAGPPTACWRIWMHCGIGPNNVCYAEGSDPYNWQRQAGATTGLTANTYSTTLVFKTGSTYFFMGQNVNNANLDIWNSTSGVSWTNQSTSVVAKGSAGTWDASSINNPSVVTSGPVAGTWYMLYEGIGTGCPHSCIGSATATDGLGVTWTKGASNPLTNLAGYGGPDLHFLNGKWYAYLHTGTLPSDIWFTTSIDFVNWTIPVPVMRRETIDEGGAATFFTTAQIADPFVLEAPCFAYTERNPDVSTKLVASSNLCSYMFMEAAQFQPPGNDFHIKLAIANLPLAQTLQKTQTTAPSSGVSSIQGTYDTQFGHIFGLSPFYWMTRVATNTDELGELAFTASTTSASYSFQGVYGIHPECTFGLQFNPGAGHVVWISTLSTATLQFSSDVAQTGNVSYRCGGRN